jgi:hypothetical protein
LVPLFYPPLKGALKWAPKTTTATKPKPNQKANPKAQKHKNHAKEDERIRGGPMHVQAETRGWGRGGTFWPSHSAIRRKSNNNNSTNCSSCRIAGDRQGGNGKTANAGEQIIENLDFIHLFLFYTFIWVM